MMVVLQWIMTEILTTSSVVRCPHGAGGRAILTSLNSRISTNGKRLLLESDIHSIKPGCPLHTPCTFIIWTKGSKTLKYNGIALLTSESKGFCMPSQDYAIISAQQTVISNG